MISRILVVSDIHHASPGEQARRGHELLATRNPLLRVLVRAYRRFIWLPDPFAHNHLLDQVLARCGDADLVVANGDFSCDSAFIGVTDDAACDSARTVLARLRGAFGAKFVPVLGDHELGKLSLFGAQGGFRLASFHRAVEELGFEPFWSRRSGRYVVLGLTSSLLAFPVYEPEALAGEIAGWRQLRETHLAEVRRAFQSLGPQDRVLLFLHDPTALPFLAAEPEVAARLHQVEATVIGHLHSTFFLRAGQMLAGMPEIRFLGNAVRRMSRALRQARCWRQFKVLLCPSLTGIELLKDGGWLHLDLGPDSAGPLRVHRHRLPR